MMKTRYWAVAARGTACDVRTVVTAFQTLVVFFFSWVIAGDWFQGKFCGVGTHTYETGVTSGTGAAYAWARRRGDVIAALTSRRSSKKGVAARDAGT